MVKKSKIHRRIALTVYLNVWRVIPVYIISRICRQRIEIKKDLQSWKNVYFPKEEVSDWYVLGYSLFSNEKACRNILLHRLHLNPVMFVISRLLFRPLNSLYIRMSASDIKGGLYFKHGFSSIVNAKEIGENCVIYQQVTIGYKKSGNPTIGKNVTICAGSIILGDIHIGDNSTVGAGAVVLDDVPANSVVGGCPAKFLKQTNGFVE